MNPDPRMQQVLASIAKNATPEYLELLKSMGYIPPDFASAPALPPVPPVAAQPVMPQAPVLSPVRRPAISEVELARYFGL